jgi:hypothetical protein
LECYDKRKGEKEGAKKILYHLGPIIFVND